MNTTTLQATPTLLKNYQVPDYLVSTVNLRFDLEEEHTTVTALIQIAKNPAAKSANKPLLLNGDQLELISLKLDGKPLTTAQYTMADEQLQIADVPNEFQLEVVTRIKPQDNTSLSGLYRVQNIYCTQCEPEGFRRMTYYPDRSDVLAIFTTTISADKERFPVLLSNGNLIAQGELPNNRHWVTWHDPFKKPSYLFALVAADLDCLEDKYVTCSGRTVKLKIFTDKGQRDKSTYAMECVKKAMKWDEQAYGREYDLDIFMIVAINAFNMGAMENKGLNIFNDRYILASPETATDTDYENILAVIGHEYFHNWSGDRVTCRDWFQLSLKEGLTIFREQEFMAAMTSPLVRRINAVKLLRNIQFIEDASPLAHPVQPDSYIEINNFYTTTIYNKGSEVIGMIKTLIGVEKFRAGMDLYFSRYDGQAVTIEEFVKAMEEASGRDLSQFRLWYKQAGTPELTVDCSYDAQKKNYKLKIQQSCPLTPGQANKKPFHLPVVMGLLNDKGEAIQGIDPLLEIKNETEVFQFTNIAVKPVPSLLRGFSAPVKLNIQLTDAELELLLKYDTDGFNRWNAGQQLFSDILLQLINDFLSGTNLRLNEKVLDIFKYLIAHTEDKYFLAELFVLPSETYLGEQMKIIEVDAIHHAREFMRQTVAEKLSPLLLSAYHNHQDHDGYHTNTPSMANRCWKNTCLIYLMLNNEPQIQELCFQQFDHGGNMTDVMTALAALVNVDNKKCEQALAQFYDKWQHDPLVIDKWFAVQARSPIFGTLKRVKSLLQHPAFNLKNPNRVRSLIGTFTRDNPVNFHATNGAGYEFLIDQVLVLDKLNPQIAARLLEPMTHWRRHTSQRQVLMCAQLERVLHTPALSKDSYEIAAKSLNSQ